MEELDLLKKSWNNTNNFDQISESEIYTMLHQKSSSVVRWIVIISLIELLLWTGTSLLFNSDAAFAKLKIAKIDVYILVSNVIHYSVVIGFIIIFYYNYKKISVVRSTRNLMNSILRTRKTVQYYIWYNLGIIALSFVFGIVLVFNLDPTISKLNQNVNFRNGFIIGFTAIAALVTTGFWMLYKLVYGRLLKKLLNNYNELKKIDL